MLVMMSMLQSQMTPTSQGLKKTNTYYLFTLLVHLGVWGGQFAASVPPCSSNSGTQGGGPSGTDSWEHNVRGREHSKWSTGS